MVPILQGKKVIFVVAHIGFQHIEYNTPKRILEAAGVTVVTASIKPGAAIAGNNSTTPVDVTTDKVNMHDYDGIFFVGGPGALTDLDNAASHHLIAQAKKLNKPMGAICISVRILAKAGALTGKKATGWDGDHALRGILEGHGAVYEEGSPVVTDGLIVTASGPAAAEKYGEGIIRVLNKQALA